MPAFSFFLYLIQFQTERKKESDMIAFHNLVKDFPSDYFLAHAYLPFLAASGRRLDEVRLNLNMALFAPLVQNNHRKPLAVVEEGRIIWRRFRSLAGEPTRYSFGQHVGMEAEQALVKELRSVASKDAIEVHGHGIMTATRGNAIVFWPTTAMPKPRLYFQ